MIYIIAIHSYSSLPPQKSVERVLHETAAVLRGGGVVAIPTDTIYGVASLVSNNEGVKRIYRMKGRQKSKPLAICVSEISDVYRCVYIHNIIMQVYLNIIYH